MLSYSRMPGLEPTECFPLAKDGSVTIYYGKTPVSILDELHPEDAEELTTDLVDEVVQDMKAFNLDTKKLLDIDADILAGTKPVDRYGKRIYSKVKDKLAERESKIYYSKSPLKIVHKQIPNQRESYYIFGPSGVGKSTCAANFAKEYQKSHPGNHIFLFSMSDYDPVFDDNIPDIIRIPLDRHFIRNHSNFNDVKHYANSLVIFDDFLMITDRSLLKAVNDFKKALFELGRKLNIDIISIQHKGLGGTSSKVEFTECKGIICFPSENLAETVKVLKTYLHYGAEEINRILDSEGKKERWMCILKPNIIITENYIKILDL